MKVRDIMTADVATAAPDSTLDEIATMMRDEDTGAIPILEEDELVGLITDRDIVIRCIAAGKDATECTAEEIVSEDLETIEPDADVREAARLMSRKQIRRLPVVEEGRLVGMLSLGDIAVKEREEIAADALENVSEGVKASKAPERARTERARPAVDRRMAPRGAAGATSEIPRRGTRSTGITRGGEERQEISNRSAEEEERRQQRVVPIREDGKTSRKRRAS